MTQTVDLHHHDSRTIRQVQVASKRERPGTSKTWTSKYHVVADRLTWR
jgi:hypothetical protein